MSWSDPIVEEVRRARDAYAARFDYDLRAIFRDLKEQEQRSGRTIVSYASEVPAQILTPASRLPAPRIPATSLPPQARPPEKS